MAKHGQLAQSYTFILVVTVETMGPINNAGISQVSNDHRKSALLFHHLSILIQRFNTVAILGTFAHTSH